MKSRRAGERFSEEDHTAEIFRRDIRVNLMLLGVGKRGNNQSQQISDV